MAEFEPFEAFELMEPPQRWYECDDCNGEGGHEQSWPFWDDPYYAVWVKCERCNGVGGFLDDETPDYKPEGDYPGLDKGDRRFYSWLRQGSAALVAIVVTSGCLPIWRAAAALGPPTNGETVIGISRLIESIVVPHSAIVKDMDPVSEGDDFTRGAIVLAGLMGIAAYLLLRRKP